MQDALSWAGDNSRRNQPKERLQDWEAGNGSDNMTEGFSERGSDNTGGTGVTESFLGRLVMAATT